MHGDIDDIHIQFCRHESQNFHVNVVRIVTQFISLLRGLVFHNPSRLSHIGSFVVSYHASKWGKIINVAIKSNDTIRMLISLIHWTPQPLSGGEPVNYELQASEKDCLRKQVFFPTLLQRNVEKLEPRRSTIARNSFSVKLLGGKWNDHRKPKTTVAIERGHQRIDRLSVLPHDRLDLQTAVEPAVHVYKNFFVVVLLINGICIYCHNNVTWKLKWSILCLIFDNLPIRTLELVMMLPEFTSLFQGNIKQPIDSSNRRHVKNIVVHYSPNSRLVRSYWQLPWSHYHYVPSLLGCVTP